MTSYLRPDERVTKGEIEAAQERSGALKSTIGAVGTLGAGALGSKAISKVLPFLSEYIPEDLAYKGINKVMPGLGTFLKSGMKQGLTLKSGLDFLRGEVEQKTKQEPAKENRNIIEQYSPELHQFIKSKIDTGEDPLRAGASAIFSQGKKFEKIIKKIEKDHNTPFSSILQTVYGQGQQPQQPQPQSINSAFQQMGGGITDNFYKGIFDSLKNGKETFSGVKDPLIAKAKPLFNQGMIKSPEDLKLFASGKLNQQSQKGQNQGNGKWDQIANTLQNLLKS